MKLRNKKTGEIVSLDGELLFDDKVVLLKQYNSLAELNEVWEDYEDPKAVYWLDNEGGINFSRNYDEYYFTKNKEIGNYFKTKEEAEKAVEKLNAWKRLKDKGFHISGWDNSIGDDYYKPSQIVIELNGDPEWDEYDNIEDIKADLDLLFGGEE